MFIGAPRYRSEYLQRLWWSDEDDASRIVASIEDAIVIGKILSHLEARSCAPVSASRALVARAPPPGVC